MIDILKKILVKKENNQNWTCLFLSRIKKLPVNKFDKKLDRVITEKKFE